MKKFLMGLTMCSVITMTSFTALAAQNESNTIVPAYAEDEIIVGTPQIAVDGEAIDLSKNNLSQYIFDINGNVMVPLRAVAEKMGFAVEWDNQSVTVSTDEWEIQMYIGEDNYVGISKNAIGMTAPQSYGAAPQLFEGTTFVPAKMFELMGYKYYSVGQFVDFTKNNMLIDENGQEYSNDTLIVSVDDDAVESDIINLFKLNGLDIIDKMDTLKMYTVKFKNPMTANDLDVCISELEKNENILAVNKNYILSLDDKEQIPNPFTVYENIDMAKKALNFNPYVPSYIPKGYEIDEITTIDDDFLQIIYKNDEGKSICYRTSKDSGDISGDYNTYANEKNISIENCELTVKGNENISVAIWNTKDMAYSIQTEEELSESEIREIFKSLK